jgi:hypothetical protein
MAYHIYIIDFSQLTSKSRSTRSEFTFLLQLKVWNQADPEFEALFIPIWENVVSWAVKE